MRFFSAVIILAFLVSGCASVEPATMQSGEEETSETVSLIPSWFNPLETSQSDSVNVVGYASATATDSSEAVLLAENSAMNNLRYEVDYITERTREALVEKGDSETYSGVTFIVKLRNTVRDLPLGGAETEADAYRDENDVYHAFVKASLEKSSLWDAMADRLADSKFIEACRMPVTN